MKREYNNQKVKPGDWVYFLEYGKYETKYSYKVVKINTPDLITVEVNKNKKDNFVGGWSSSLIGDGKYWNVECWCINKHCCNELEIE